jgi:hypothetical protein
MMLSMFAITVTRGAFVMRTRIAGDRIPRPDRARAEHR